MPLSVDLCGLESLNINCTKYLSYKVMIFGLLIGTQKPADLNLHFYSILCYFTLGVKCEHALL